MMLDGVKKRFSGIALMVLAPLPSNPTWDEAQRLAALPHEKLVETVLSLGQQLLQQQRQIEQLERQIAFIGSGPLAVLSSSKANEDGLPVPKAPADSNQGSPGRTQLRPSLPINANDNKMGKVSPVGQLHDTLSYQVNVFMPPRLSIPTNATDNRQRVVD